ncbi:hypothetical protein [Dyadobacter luticola]|uniref:YfhO family protein n=1 Tax=Dyadobacter luticola TaxID=1979387 RepID=A0A5R9KXT7_9BACT|nr:hypothetical protein [Dyadobacter luticola]TLV01122.1 hypothetical protein FEN17_16860 [Dyadobacter luticola]
MSDKYRNPLFFLFILLPVFIYLIYSWSLSEPLFFSDDFHLLKTVLWVGEEPSFLGKVQLFLQQHNEHRIVIPRLITYINYLIFGHINWPVLILLGNVLWVAILWFFWKSFRVSGAAIWLFIPAPLIMLNPQYYDNVTWSISILQQSVIVFWFVVLSYLCSKEKYKAALVVCLIATFTHGNGIFSFLIALLFTFYDRNWKWSGIIAGAWVLTGILYFFNFSKGQNADFMQSLSDPVRLISCFFAFFGSLSKVRFADPMAAVFIGMAFYLALAAFIITRFFYFQKRNLALPWTVKMVAGIFAFLSITGALVSVSRSWGGIETIIAPRYQHYSSFVACLVYLVLISVLTCKTRKIVGVTGIVGGLLFNALSYFSYTEELLYRRDWLLADDTNWTHHSNFLIYGASFNTNIRLEYQRVVQKGICISGDHFGHIQEDSLQANQAAKPINLQYEHFTKEEKDASRSYNRDYIAISNDNLDEKSIFIYLKPQNGAQGYWLACRKSHSGIFDFLKTGKWLKPGFSVEFLTENLSPGDYQIAILRKNRLSWTSTNVTITAPAPVK